MIDLQYLANAINRTIGTSKYAVHLNTNIYPEERGKTIVTMSATRVPFGFTTEEIDAESLIVTLTFDLSAVDVSERDDTLSMIKNELLGWKKFTVTDIDKSTYAAESFFEQQPPTTPYTDYGGITQQIVVSGNVLIKNTNCGAVVGNNIKVYINGTQLLKSRRVGSMQAAAENNLSLSENETLPDSELVSRVHTTQLSCIFTGKDIEKTFLKIAEGEVDDLNTVYTYKVEYPVFDEGIESKIKITSVVIEDVAGAFLQYTLTYQKVKG